MSTTSTNASILARRQAAVPRSVGHATPISAAAPRIQ
ncbi:hypothetical protein ABID26_007350 [Mesorhizobium shonense]|uniref:Uncharacterized protein n=1 Tax=Mesorhizobium shonense TaxID=1209948 RepID=A0ABV2I4X5_9HYPH